MEIHGTRWGNSGTWAIAGTTARHTVPRTILDTFLSNHYATSCPCILRMHRLVLTKCRCPHTHQCHLLGRGHQRPQRRVRAVAAAQREGGVQVGRRRLLRTGS